MNTTKPYYRIAHAISGAVHHFHGNGRFRPSHCDVRCYINDELDAAEKSGFRVNHGYSQDRAFRIVRRSLRHG